MLLIGFYPLLHFGIIAAVKDHIAERFDQIPPLHLDEIGPVIVPCKTGAFLIAGRFRQHSEERIESLDGQFIPLDQTPMARAVRNGESVEGAEAIVQNPDGRRWVARVNVKPLRDPSGTVVGAINCFQDITQEFEMRDALKRQQRTFDLAMSLEVAEHLPPKSAEGFIAGLTKLAPVVLFSAAIPFQGGTNHVNEQWPQYWADLFARHGFDAIDCIRSEVWDNEEVEWWYAQNTILYANEAGLKAHPNLRKFNSSIGLSVVHPRQYLHLAEGLPPPPGLWQSLSLTVAATKRALLKRLAPSPAPDR